MHLLLFPVRTLSSLSLSLSCPAGDSGDRQWLLSEALSLVTGQLGVEEEEEELSSNGGSNTCGEDIPPEEQVH